MYSSVPPSLYAVMRSSAVRELKAAVFIILLTLPCALPDHPLKIDKDRTYNDVTLVCKTHLSIEVNATFLWAPTTTTDGKVVATGTHYHLTIGPGSEGFYSCEAQSSTSETIRLLGMLPSYT